MNRKIRRHSLAPLARIIQTLEEWIFAGSILTIAAVTIVNVFCRTILNTSLTFAEEMAQFSIILLTFVGLSYGASKGRHIRMSAVYDQLGPRGRKVLMVVIASSTALLMFLMAYYAIRYIATVRALGSVSPALQVPLALVYYAVPVGFVLTGVQYGLTVVRNLTARDVYLSYTEKDDYHESPPHAL